MMPLSVKKLRGVDVSDQDRNWGVRGAAGTWIDTSSCHVRVRVKVVFVE